MPDRRSITSGVTNLPAVLISVALLLMALIFASETMVKRDGASAAPSLVLSCVAPTDTPTATTTPQAPKKTIVVAAFTGFLGAGGGPANGMQQLLNAYPPVGGNVVAKARFAHFQQRRAVAFIQRHSPPAEIVLVGHSFGGDATIEVAERLAKVGLSVKAIVQIDSVGIGDSVLPANVAKGLNYWQTAAGVFEPEGEHPVRGSTNVHAETHFPLKANITHINIDNNPNLHAEVVDFSLGAKPTPVSPGVTPATPTPGRKVTVQDPLCINAASPVLTSWDSGVVSLKGSKELSQDDGLIIDVDFNNKVLYMADTTNALEFVTIDVDGGSLLDSHQLEVELQFDDRGAEFQSGQAAGLLSVSSPGSGTFQETVNLTDKVFAFGGFTLEIVQNGGGIAQIDSVRVQLQADIISETSVGGIAELPDVDTASLQVADSSGPGAGAVVGVVAAVAAGALALGGAAWYARRRWLM